MKFHLRSLLLSLLAIGFLAAAGPAYPGQNPEKKPRDDAKYTAWLQKEVRHQLVMLPYYTVFDNLEYRVEGDKVILSGQVTRPALKSDAENAVKSLEGVSQVVNNIEVLPPSPMDDQLRHSLFRAIYGDSALSKYAWPVVQSIHIIVNGGHVTLEGVVDNEGDKNIAGIRANGVPDVFSVQNNLRVEKH
ncbi:MAG: BON domain-containing protein [Candidatus Acidiferrales bacterium]|jgi:hyperosmotically inducible protein